MQYFLHADVAVLDNQALPRLAALAGDAPIGIQVAKNNLRAAESLKRAIEGQSQAAECVVLADSDRCCVDWVAVEHSKAGYLLKESFACPLLGAYSSGRERRCQVGVYLPTVDYAPAEPLPLPAALPPLLESVTLYLAVDSHQLAAEESIRAQLQCYLQRPITCWRYSAALPSDHLVLVRSDNAGMLEYFRENTRSVVLSAPDIQTPAALWSCLESGIALADQRRMTCLLQKLHLGDKVRQAKIFGIVFTSAEHLELVAVIAKYLDLHGKKFYHFFINGLKPEKLGNFLGIDVFVVVQCPFSSFRFEANVVSVRPYELVVGLNANWSGRYTTKLDDALAELRALVLQTGPEPGSASEGPATPQVLEIAQGCNRLQVAPGEVATREQAIQYFQTGEALKSLGSITVREALGDPLSSEPNPSNILHQGYAGIPTNYRQTPGS